MVEILVVLAVTGIVTTGLVSFMISQSRGYNLQEDLAEMEQNARIAMEYFTNQLRQANSVAVITSDDDPTDDIVPLIDVDGERYFFRKRSSSAGANPTNEMDSERIFRSTGNVAYFLQDVNGDGNLDLPMFQRSGDIVTITIVGRTRHRDPDYTNPRFGDNGGYRQVVLTSRVVLRNS